MMLLIGTMLEWIEPDGDIWDRVKVTGYQNVGEVDEFVLTSVEGFASPISATAASIFQIYSVVSDGAASAPFETPIEELAQ